MPVLCTPLQVKCYQSVLHNGVYRNMRKLKNQNQALVQLHFSSFYQGALGKKNITDVHLGTKQWHCHILRYCNSVHVAFRSNSSF